MGQNNQKLPQLQKIDLEVQLQNVFERLKILRNRKINDLITKEIDIREKIKEKPDKFIYDDLKYEFMPIVKLYNQVEIIKTIMRYAYSLKNYTMRITAIQNSKNFEDLEQLQPYFEGIIWSGLKLNQNFIMSFSLMIEKYFGADVYHQLTQYEKLNDDLKYGFNDLEPNDQEIQKYVKKFLKRYRIKVNNFFPVQQGFKTTIEKNQTVQKQPQMAQSHQNITTSQKEINDNKTFDDILEEFCNSEIKDEKIPEKNQLKQKLDYESALYIKNLMKDKNEYNVNLQSALSNTKKYQLQFIQLNDINER